MTARIIEIFHSLQGEGIFLGEPMTFVRFFGCNLTCDYCDTGYARDEARTSELSSDRAIEQIKQMTPRGEFVSLTGGEPLMQADFILDLGSKLKALGYKLYLETNGTLPLELGKVLSLADTVAMDIKPPSACGANLWDAHREFLAIAWDKAFVKLVVTANTTAAEAETAVQLVAGIDRTIYFILQPAGGPLAPDMQFVRKCRANADQYLARVSIIAQMHKFWGVR